MLSQPKNRVQAIKSKFESLQSENEVLIRKKSVNLSKYTDVKPTPCAKIITEDTKEDKENDEIFQEEIKADLNTNWTPQPNSSYLYSSNDFKVNIDTKVSLSRQCSDPGKKLHRSHAFRCDRSQIMSQGPKRHGSCNGRSETSDFSLKRNEKRLSKDRLKQLGNFIEDQMRKENFIPSSVEVESKSDSIPDSDVPKHILDQYAKVDKNKKTDKQDSLTDSGVSSETENVEEEKNRKIKKLVSQYEKPDISNLESMDDLCGSNETMKLERKNPHLILTDTLKKALKQPLPSGPPPKKPPRALATQEPPEKHKKDTKKMLEKLELALQKREAINRNKNIYDIAEDNVTDKPKEIHYLCTEILGITPVNQPKDPFTKCLNSLNCAIVTNNSTLSLPYTRLNDAPCSCSSENLAKRLSTFQDSSMETKCDKCRLNDDKDGFKCHLNCECRSSHSEFFLQKEHIYDVPFVDGKRDYGALNSWKENYSRSMEDLRNQEASEKIYDEPCEISRPATPEEKTDFQKLRENFENLPELKRTFQKPRLTKKPLAKVWRSTENVSDEFKFVKRGGKFATEDTKRCRKGGRVEFSLPKDRQLDVDRENLNRLMTEIYETVTAACNMDENKPGSFPTNLDSTSEESVKLTRSLTEKRKNYVRRVSSRVAYLEQGNVKARFRHQTSVCSYRSEADNPYSTFRSWKSFRTSQSNLNVPKMADQDLTDANVTAVKLSASAGDVSIDEKTGCVDIGLPFEPRERGLFNVCILVGLNYMTGQAYVKSVFPSQVKVPPHIENLIFPETLSSRSVGEWSSDENAQCYSIVLTDERGERAYGYCRRVLPEGATMCLPLCYCVIGKYRAPGFYYKLLQEIESHHGNPEVEINSILQQLFETDFPSPGEQITITYNKTERETDRERETRHAEKSRTMPRKADVNVTVTVKREITEREATENDRAKSDIVLNRDSLEKHELPDFYDIENNNSPKRALLSLESPRIRTIKRPIEPRIDDNSLSALLDRLGSGLAVKLFGTLLLERKLVVAADQIGVVSACMEGLQAALYPFVWQQPLISLIPAEIQRDVLEAPVPLLAGMLADRAHAQSDVTVQFEEGMLIDLTQPGKVLFYQGDESTILPSASYKTLKTSLQMETNKQKDRQDTQTRNVMISEAFLRFFVDILGDFWKFFDERQLNEGELGRDGYVFDKESFIKNASSKQNQYFLEWFTETAMFNHFIQNMALLNANQALIDTPLPNFYELFNQRVQSRSKSNAKISDRNYKSAMNKKVKMLKTKLRDLVT